MFSTAFEVSKGALKGFLKANTELKGFVTIVHCVCVIWTSGSAGAKRT